MFDFLVLRRSQQVFRQMPRERGNGIPLLSWELDSVSFKKIFNAEI